jgi:ferredoxin-NADP reductase
LVQPGQELFPLMGLSGGREHQAEPHGAASGYAREKLGVDDTVEASAARGEFTLRPGDTPVILLSAGIGVTPVLAMFYALSGERSAREVWWLYGARNGREDPFAEEACELLGALGRKELFYSYGKTFA